MARSRWISRRIEQAGQQAADLIAVEQAVAKPGADQHAAVVQRVDALAARHVDNPDGALRRHQRLVRGERYGGVAAGARLLEGAPQVVHGDGTGVVAARVQPYHDRAAVGVGEGHRGGGQRVRIGLRQKNKQWTGAALKIYGIA